MRSPEYAGSCLSAANMFQAWDRDGDEFRMEVNYDTRMFLAPGQNSDALLNEDQATALKLWLDRRLRDFEEIKAQKRE